MRPHVEEEVSRNQDNVTGKLRQVGLRDEGVRRCSIHSDSQTLIRQRRQRAARGDKYSLSACRGIHTVSEGAEPPPPRTKCKVRADRNVPCWRLSPGLPP